MTVLACNPPDLAQAGATARQTGHDAEAALTALSDVLNGCGGMAGTDEAGLSWAQSYDPTAGQAIRSASAAITACGKLADLLQATAANYSHADSASTLGGGTTPLDPPTGALPVPASPPPSAAGGGAGAPPLWGFVEHLVGYLWPNGHQDRLHAASSAWRSAASAMHRSLGPISSAQSAIEAQRLPEVPRMLASLGAVRTAITDVADTCTSLGRSCDEYARHLDDAHHKILAALSELGGLASPTGLLGEVVSLIGGGDEIEEKLERVAAKIRSIIAALITLAREVATTVRALVAGLVQAIEQVTPLLEVTVQFAGELIYNRAYDQLAPIVNGIGAAAMTVIHHPEDVATMAAGVAGIVGGIGGEIGGGLLDATGVGAPAGVAVNIASAGLIGAGATGVGLGASRFAQHLSGEQGGEVMPPRDSSSGVPMRGLSDNVKEELAELRNGRNPRVKVVDSEAELQQVFDKLTTDSKPATATKYPGEVRLLPDGTEVSLRNKSASGGSTIDITPPRGTGKSWKIHVQQ